MNAFSSYSASLTSDQFLFHEMRITAKLLAEGMTDEDVIAAIVRDNLFQYPTEKSLRKVARACLKRLQALDDAGLVHALAALPATEAKQVCLYAMMCDSRLVRDFMVTVIGEKYRTLDMSWSRAELNAFFMRLAEQDDRVALWSDATVQKIKGVLVRILVENGYLDSFRASHLNSVLPGAYLEEKIRARNDIAALSAFSCMA